MAADMPGAGPDVRPGVDPAIDTISPSIMRGLTFLALAHSPARPMTPTEQAKNLLNLAGSEQPGANTVHDLARAIGSHCSRTLKLAGYVTSRTIPDNGNGRPSTGYVVTDLGQRHGVVPTVMSLQWELAHPQTFLGDLLRETRVNPRAGAPTTAITIYDSLLRRSDGASTIGQLQIHSGRPRRTIHRLLTRLVADGIMVLDGSAGGYRITEAARPAIEDLVRRYRQLRDPRGLEEVKRSGRKLLTSPGAMSFLLEKSHRQTAARE